MTQGDVHDNHGTYSAYEYATGKYALPVTVVPGIPSEDVAGTEVQGTSEAGTSTNQGNPVRVGAKYKATAVTRTDGQTADLVTDASENLKTTDATAKSKTIDSIETRPEATTYVNLTASALVRTGAGILVGMYVNSTSSGTIKLWDNTSAATTVINNTITPAIGYHPLGNTAFATGLYATIASTLDVTLYYIPTP